MFLETSPFGVVGDKETTLMMVEIQICQSWTEKNTTPEERRDNMRLCKHLIEVLSTTHDFHLLHKILKQRSCIVSLHCLPVLISRIHSFADTLLQQAPTMQFSTENTDT